MTATGASGEGIGDELSADGLLRRQDERQAAALDVIADLGLDVRLPVFGEAVRTGSSVLGLMVRRDVDVTVCCPALDVPTVEAVVSLGAELARHPRVWQVTYRDDTGAWNVEPENYPDGLYLAIKYRGVGGDDWNFDLWFVDEPERQPDIAALATMPGRLTREARVAILRLKEAWDVRPEYGRSVRGVDVYSAVLDDGVGTVAEFEAWLARRDG